MVRYSRVGLVLLDVDNVFADAGPSCAPGVSNILNVAVGAFDQVDGA